jgi:hypothetical protein
MFRKCFFAAVILIALIAVYTHPDFFTVQGATLAMAIAVKDLTASAAKYSRNAGNAAQDYKAGVAGAGQKWHDNTKANVDNYGAGVQAAISNGSFAKGIDKAGPDRYVTRSTTKGAAAFPAGVQAGGPRWAQNFAPFAQALASATLPPKGPKGAPQNQARSQYVADLFRRKKING